MHGMSRVVTWLWTRRVNIVMSVIWLAMAALFSRFASYHYVESTRRIPPFERQQRAFQDRVDIKVLGTLIDQPIDDFVHDFNAYLDQQNASSARSNRVAGCDFALAGIIALISAGLQWREDLSRLARSRLISALIEDKQ